MKYTAPSHPYYSAGWFCLARKLWLKAAVEQQQQLIHQQFVIVFLVYIIGMGGGGLVTYRYIYQQEG